MRPFERAPSPIDNDYINSILTNRPFVIISLNSNLDDYNTTSLAIKGSDNDIPLTECDISSIDSKINLDKGNTMNFTLINIPQPVRQAITAEDHHKVGSVILRNENDLNQYNNSRVPSDLIIDGLFNLSYDLTLMATKNIIFRENSRFTLQGNKALKIMSGIEDQNYNGTVIFENHIKPQIFVEGDGKVYIYYNPAPKLNEDVYKHKYYHPDIFLNHIWPPFDKSTEYMLVNDIYDLQNIRLKLNGKFALSKNIDASETKKWNEGKGFASISIPNDNQKSPYPFCGEFDGNSFKISELYINRPTEDNIGLFGFIMGSRFHKAEIKNLELHNLNITGDSYVGGFCGEATYASFNNISITGSSHILGKGMAGGIAGSASGIIAQDLYFTDFKQEVVSGEYDVGQYFGAIRDSTIYNDQFFCDDIKHKYEISCIGHSLNICWD
jgi:hypothetical protein